MQYYVIPAQGISLRKHVPAKAGSRGRESIRMIDRFCYLQKGHPHKWMTLLAFPRLLAHDVKHVPTMGNNLPLQKNIAVECFPSELVCLDY